MVVKLVESSGVTEEFHSHWQWLISYCQDKISGLRLEQIDTHTQMQTHKDHACTDCNKTFPLSPHSDRLARQHARFSWTTLYEIVQIWIVADPTNSKWFYGSCLSLLSKLTQYTFWQSTSTTQLHNNSQVFWSAACLVYIALWRKT